MTLLSRVVNIAYIAMVQVGGTPAEKNGGPPASSGDLYRFYSKI